jgi:hypothetical protein
MRESRKLHQPVAFFLLAIFIAVLTGCGGGSSTTTTATSPAITTATVPDGTVGAAYSTSVQASGGTAPYAWSVSSGTLPAGITMGSSTSNSVTLGGTPTSAQSGAQFTLQVKDSANKMGTKAYTVNVTSTVSVAISNKVAGIAPAASAVTFNAALQNDTASQGVTWTLTANSADCAPACGSLSGATATSVTYTPPATLPIAPNNMAKVTATAVADASKSDFSLFSITNSPLSACTNSGNEAALNGKYAFLIQGSKAVGSSQMAGSFTADGTGKITAGEVDANGAAASHANLDTTATTYSVGADNRGCMTLVAGSSSTVIHFALSGITANVAAKGRLIQFDDTLGTTGIRATGMLMKQDTTVITTNLAGNYVFSLQGADSVASRYAAAGAVTVSGGLLSNGEVDTDNAGTAAHATGAAGLLGASVDANGRGTFTLSPTVLFPTNFAFYVVSHSEVLVASTDAITVSAPVVSGELRLQSGTFTNASLNGVSVLHTAGLSGTARSAAIGTLTTDGAGNVTAAIYNDDAGTVAPVANTTTTYAVAANGRATLGGSLASVVYLTGSNAGFVFGNDAATTTGELEAQAAGPFSASSLTGAFSFGTESVGNNATSAEVGVVTPDGSGMAALSIDLSTHAGLSIDNSQSSAYTVNADGTGTVSGDTMIIVSPSKIVVLDSASGNVDPDVVVLEK